MKPSLQYPLSLDGHNILTAVLYRQVCQLCVCVVCHFASLDYRDGMIKRPGNEGYLNKLIEEERISDSSGLQLAET